MIHSLRALSPCLTKRARNESRGYDTLSRPFYGSPIPPHHARSTDITQAGTLAQPQAPDPEPPPDSLGNPTCTGPTRTESHRTRASPPRRNKAPPSRSSRTRPSCTPGSASSARDHARSRGNGRREQITLAAAAHGFLRGVAYVHQASTRDPRHTTGSWERARASRRIEDRQQQGRVLPGRD